MIGVFDSGVGGLSVLREIRTLMPHADLSYVADRGRAPYGTRTMEEVRDISHDVAKWLMDRGANCLVLACNTASAAALESLREDFPRLPIVGMEPAVKPAVAKSRSGTVAVFATAATFQGELFASVVDRFASGVEVVTRACPEWVDLVERGVVDGPMARAAVEESTETAIACGADQVVLGCTHFSFLAPVITAVTGVDVIDPAPAVAAQVKRVAPEVGGDGNLSLAASGDVDEFARLADSIAGIRGNVIPFTP